MIASLQVRANSNYLQAISLSGKNMPLTYVFSTIEKQTGLSFFFNISLVKNAKPVTLDLHQVSLDRALRETLKDEDLDFYQTGKTIFIVKKPSPKAVSDILPELGNKIIDVKGRVVDEHGISLRGASVVEKGTNHGVFTDERGEFLLKAVSASSTIEISYLGYQRKEVEAGNSEISTIRMIIATNKLDEAQVIAYGKTSQRLSIGNISTVGAKDIEKQPVTNPLLALEGRVPGLFVTQATGLPGSGVTVRIQGQNSIAYGNDPLYVVDGIPYPSQNLPTTSASAILGGSGGSALVPAGSGNPLSFINPLDIESITVLKDADATAIYGSRGANGVILITTKRGQVGPTKVDFNAHQGWGQVAHKMHLLNTSQYLNMRREALKNDGIASPSATDYDLNSLWDQSKNTDWQKQLIGNTSKITDVQGEVSGGTAGSQFLVGANYHREGSVFPVDVWDQRGSLHFNFNNESPNQKFRFTFSGSYLVDNNHLIPSDLTLSATGLAPNAPSLRNPDGTLNWALAANGNSSWGTNTLAQTLNTSIVSTKNLIGNSAISYQILKGLDIKCNLGYNRLELDEMYLLPLSSVAPQYRASVNRSATFGNGTIDTWIVEPQVTYKQFIGKGKLDLLIGSTIQQSNSNRQQLTGTGYISDLVLADIKSASTVTVASSTASVYKYNAVFARAGYNWADKYIIDLIARRDGSSRFGSNNQLHNFWSFGGGWLFSKEEFVVRNFGFLRFGKLRGSYGTTGNDQIGDYQFLNLYKPLSVGVPYQSTVGINTSALPNPYLQWEETRKLQFGIDLSVFSDRILFSANYFLNHSSNQLLSVGLPITTGFGSITENLPATVENYGWELTINSINISKANFTWNSSFNLTIARNKLTAFPNLAQSIYSSQYVIGKSISITKVLNSIGVNPNDGAYQFLSSKGIATEAPNFTTDRTILLDVKPKYYGGLNNELTYKGFELDFLLQFVKQIAPNFIFGTSTPGLFNTNEPVSVLARWQNKGDLTRIQRFNSNSTLATGFLYETFSQAGYSDASYVRLKNLFLSYRLPGNWQKKAGLKSLKVYVQAQNLFTITKYTGLDPETLSVRSLPTLHVLTTGIQVGL
jgi:TonB-linked SusC/RagA family outer membrane protein